MTTSPRRPRLFRLLPLSVVALLFAAGGLVELLVRGPVPAGYRPDGPPLLLLTLAVGLSVLLLWWSPLAGLTAGVALIGIQAVAGYEVTLAAAAAVVFASFLTVAFDRWWRALTAGFVVAAGLIVVLLALPSFDWRAVIAAWVTISVLWVVAVVVRVYRGGVEQAERRARLFADDRDARASEAVADERARLARELHDSVGHALNVVVLHAGAAQRMVDRKPDLAREALASIEVASRQALVDIERMLGILRAHDEQMSYDVAPGMHQLQAFCARVREAGLEVDLSVEGRAPALPASLDLTAFRIIQESLTNTLKHAGRARATVVVRYEPTELLIEVLDNGRGVASTSSVGGRGLLGMRERVTAFRGELEAGPRVEGGFGVRARLPLPED